MVKVSKIKIEESLSLSLPLPLTFGRNMVVKTLTLLFHFSL